MSTRGRPWTAEQRARFRATVAAKRSAVRCDICGIEPGKPSGNFGPAKVMPFQLAHQTERPDGKFTRRGVGVILLCQRCWTETAARRRRRQNVRSGDVESAHKLLNAS